MRRFAMFAGLFGAATAHTAAVDIERVIENFETAVLGNGFLAFFDLGVVKLLDAAAIDADQVIVVLAVVDFENGLAGFEEVTLEQPSLFKLGKDAVDGGQSNIHVFSDQRAIDVFCRHVTLGAFFEQLKNLQSGESRFQTNVLEALWVAHRRGYPRIVCGWAVNYFGYDIPLQRCLRNPETRMSRYRIQTIVIFCALLGACSYKPSFINEYKIDVQQGNVLSQEMVAQLKPGQTREQVRFVLGTPMISDIFHQQRWDYVYRYQNGQTERVETRKFSVFFNADGLLERVGGDADVATVADLTAAPVNTRLVDLGTLSGEAADKPMPPREEPTYYRRFMNMLGL